LLPTVSPPPPLRLLLHISPIRYPTLFLAITRSLVFGEEAATCSTTKHVLSTALMITLALALAVVVTDISIPFGFLGASINPIICYIIPAVIFWNIRPVETRPWERYMAAGIAVFMGVSGLYSLYAQIVGLIDPAHQ
jgi:hypothetical protein